MTQPAKGEKIDFYNAEYWLTMWKAELDKYLRKINYPPQEGKG